jgi:hypothetical protein
MVKSMSNLPALQTHLIYACKLIREDIDASLSAVMDWTFCSGSDRTSETNCPRHHEQGILPLQSIYKR